jgi:hypothetical protein
MSVDAEQAELENLEQTARAGTDDQNLRVEGASDGGGLAQDVNTLEGLRCRKGRGL